MNFGGYGKDKIIIDNINGIPLTSDILNKFKYETIISVIDGGFYTGDDTDYKLEDYIYNIDVKSQLYQFTQKLYKMDKDNIKFNENSLFLIGLAGNGKTSTSRLINSLIGSSKLFRISPYYFFSLKVKESSTWKEYFDCLFVIANQCFNKSVIEIEDYHQLNQRSTNNQYEGDEQIRNYFLQQCLKYPNILIIGISNRPEELTLHDINSFSKCLYLPSPDKESRLLCISNWAINVKNTLSKSNFKQLSNNTEHFTFADLNSLLRTTTSQLIIRLGGIDNIDLSDSPVLIFNDFINSLKNCKPSYSLTGLNEFRKNCLKLNLKINN